MVRGKQSEGLKRRSFSDAVIANQGKYNLEYCNKITNIAGRRVWGFAAGIRNPCTRPLACASYPTRYYLAHNRRQICSSAAPRMPYVYGFFRPLNVRWSLKLTRHNGRAGKHGTYNPKHNDRSFEIANSEHINPERVQQNIYWDCYNGIRSALHPKSEYSLVDTFEEVEKLFTNCITPTSPRVRMSATPKSGTRNETATFQDLLSSKKTCPGRKYLSVGNAG